MNRFFLILIGLIFTFQAFADEESVQGKYDNLIQRIDCSADEVNYGKSYDYGYWAGGAWCGKTGKAGYWVWVSPSWFVWENKKIREIKKNHKKKNITESEKNRNPKNTQDTKTLSIENINIEKYTNQIVKIGISSFLNALSGNQNPQAISIPDNSSLPLSSNNSTNNKPEINSNIPGTSFSTTRGDISPLIDDGTKFVGTYNDAQYGYINLKNKGDAFIGYWTQKYSETKCNTPKIGRNGIPTYYWGRVIVRETNSGVSGLWSYCTGSPDKKWGLL